jgi:hypothetical protein
MYKNLWGIYFILSLQYNSPIKGNSIPTHQLAVRQEMPAAYSIHILEFLIYLLRNITVDIKQIHQIYFMKILYFVKTV